MNSKYHKPYNNTSKSTLNMAPNKKQKKNPTVDKDDHKWMEEDQLEQLEKLEKPDEEEDVELSHKEQQTNGKEIEKTLTPVNKDTSETTDSGKDNRYDYSIDKKLKAERLSYMITQAVEKELMKVETKTNNYTVDYCRTTNVLKSISELIDKQSQLNQEQRRVESEMKKLMAEVSKDIMNHEVLNEHLNWSHIVDITKKGRGLTVQYNDGTHDSFAKLNEYANLKAIEMKKFPNKNTYVMDKEVMDKITKEYMKRDDGGQLMDNIEGIIMNHKNQQELFDKDFYEDFFKE